MSLERDNPFARWSRRKQAARQAETPDDPENAAEAADHGESRSGYPQLPSSEAAADPDAAQLSQPLPRIEDLTAESDLSAFLRRGIPATLKNTALRKMWSLDPTIRDYVGPSDYAWDFNTPGSMRGFGVLEAGKSVADFLSRVGGSDEQEMPAESEAESPRQAVAAPDEEANASAQDAACVAGQDAEAPAPAQVALQAKRLETPRHGVASDRAANAADAAKPLPSPGKSPLSRHGGALPR